MKKNIRDLQLNEIEEVMSLMGEPKFRAMQIFAWLCKGIEDFDEMQNVPLNLRKKLDEEFFIGFFRPAEVQISALDGTRKYLFVLKDGNAVESVFMKYKYGNTICVSSQVGCRMGCRFCASTLAGLVRNLSPGEMVQQLLAAEKDTGEKINHIVVMGSGEPFDNYENVASFIKIVTDSAGIGLSMRNITVSTCGIIPNIHRFAKDFPQVNLAISLHSPTDKGRSEIMPVNKKYPVKELIEACRKYTEETSRRITFEYTLVRGVNDNEEHAAMLASLLKGMRCHVNLIPLNKVEETGLETTVRKQAGKFLEALEKRNIAATIRRELGDDIDGACGQLRLKTMAKSAQKK
ncbi:MAG: 23S rRNA (adenine(2503)-C(2))-methyltransferase RlmN [Clostridiales bacterium]|nr:23S rRNA (adenine(2503)-C(2))-methyltransferase RlmN [Bacillota bacterium]MEE0516543.1 23S rRNA (adenine(2503)-C(2))-methyltransferase RlmN [Anaerovoracaceae bacterium]PWL93452.1 MAG: 23S rRNA (adenine(2503)-C(2))-methyltransferase RlmN [Clostridiales bacterium]